MKIVTILGARPQFIKAATVSRKLNEYNSTSKNKIEEIVVHTGQHFDRNMSDIFFNELHIPTPKYNLGINSLTHGAMTGRMIEEIENILLIEKPEWILLYGDTNSTLAGSIAAKKLSIKVAHVEAGLRSNDNDIPEEINRVLTDRISDVLFCPTIDAVKKLESEGYRNFNCCIKQNGDVMLDSALYYKRFEKKPRFNIPPRFILSTIHRQSNTDNVEYLKNIISAFNTYSEKIPIILPIHPRTKKYIQNNNITISDKLLLTDPVGYLEMIFLLKRADMVITDSGGVQKESYFFKKPCLILIDKSPWYELLEKGYIGINPESPELIISNIDLMINKDIDYDLSMYGNGKASKKIVDFFINLSSKSV